MEQTKNLYFLVDFDSLCVWKVDVRCYVLPFKCISLTILYVYEFAPTQTHEQNRWMMISFLKYFRQCKCVCALRSVWLSGPILMLFYFAQCKCIYDEKENTFLNNFFYALYTQFFMWLVSQCLLLLVFFLHRWFMFPFQFYHDIISVWYFLFFSFLHLFAYCLICLMLICTAICLCILAEVSDIFASNW